MDQLIKILSIDMSGKNEVEEIIGPNETELQIQKLIEIINTIGMGIYRSAKDICVTLFLI